MGIYTKTGDRGETGLLCGRRVGKDDARISAYGDLDELSAFLGAARAARPEARIAAAVERVQHQLFSACAQLSAAEAADKPNVPRVDPNWTRTLELEIDAADAELPPLKNFVLSGGTPAASMLHVARTVCRRAERELVALRRAEPVDETLMIYVNRLSDWLFTMARLENHRAGLPDPIWTKG